MEPSPIATSLLQQFKAIPHEYFTPEDCDFDALGYTSILNSLLQKRTAFNQYKIKIRRSEDYQPRKSLSAGRQRRSQLIQADHRQAKENDIFYITQTVNILSAREKRVNTNINTNTKANTKTNIKPVTLENEMVASTLSYGKLFSGNFFTEGKESKLMRVEARVKKQKHIRRALEADLRQLTHSINSFKAEIRSEEGQIRAQKIHLSEGFHALEELRKEEFHSKRSKKIARFENMKAASSFCKQIQIQRLKVEEALQQSNRKVTKVSQAILELKNLNERLGNQHQILQELDLRNEELHRKAGQQRGLEKNHRKMIEVYAYIQLIREDNSSLSSGHLRLFQIKEIISAKLEKQSNLWEIDILETLTEASIFEQQCLSTEHLFKIEQRERGLTQLKNLKLRMKKQEGELHKKTDSQDNVLLQILKQKEEKILQVCERLCAFERILGSVVSPLLKRLKLLGQRWLSRDLSFRAVYESAVRNLSFLFEEFPGVNAEIVGKKVKEYFSRAERFSDEVNFLIKNRLVMEHLSQTQFETYLKRIVKSKIERYEVSSQLLFSQANSELHKMQLIRLEKRVKIMFGMFLKIRNYLLKGKILLHMVEGNPAEIIKVESRHSLKKSEGGTMAKFQYAQLTCRHEPVAENSALTLSAIKKMSKMVKLDRMKIKRTATHENARSIF